MYKRSVSILLSVILLVSTFASFPSSASAASFENQLKEDGFPSSYISSLVALHKKYPNWSFKAFHTGLDWEKAVDGERSSHSNQVIEKSSSLSNAYYCKCSKCYKNGKYVYQESSHYSASEAAVKYYMDPRNWFSESSIFQFESSKYNSKHTISGVESVLSSTFMHKAYITYVNSSGKTVTYKDSKDNKVKYSTAIMNAAKNSGLSAYYLASKIVQEVGTTKASNVGGTCGTRSPFKSIYNYYNIGAYSGANDGLHWANGKMWATSDTTLYSSYDSKFETVGGKKTAVKKHQYMTLISLNGKYLKVRLYNKKGSNSYSTDGKVGYILKSKTDYSSLSYGRPWTNPYKSIYNGAEYIADGYLTYQYTPYLQKFNVNTKSPETHSHEYLTNVNGAANASKIAYKAYDNADLLSSARTFYIPVYKNMPSKKCPVPGTSSASSKPPTASKPKKVTGLKLSSRGVESLKIKWTAVSKATKYDVYLKSNRTGKVYHKTVKTNSATLSNLTAANSYDIKVRAYKSGYGDYSSKLVEITKPKKPPIKTPSTNKKHQIIVKWSSVSCSGYQVQFSRKSNFSTVIATKKASKSATSYTGKNFTKGRTYYVRVRAYKTIGKKTVYSSWSSKKKIVSK